MYGNWQVASSGIHTGQTCTCSSSRGQTKNNTERSTPPVHSGNQMQGTRSAGDEVRTVHRTRCGRGGAHACSRRSRIKWNVRLLAATTQPRRRSHCSGFGSAARRASPPVAVQAWALAASRIQLRILRGGRPSEAALPELATPGEAKLRVVLLQRRQRKCFLHVLHRRVAMRRKEEWRSPHRCTQPIRRRKHAGELLLHPWA